MAAGAGVRRSRRAAQATLRDIAASPFSFGFADVRPARTAYGQLRDVLVFFICGCQARVLPAAYFRQGREAVPWAWNLCPMHQHLPTATEEELEAALRGKR